MGLKFHWLFMTVNTLNNLIRNLKNEHELMQLHHHNWLWSLIHKNWMHHGMVNFGIQVGGAFYFTCHFSNHKNFSFSSLHDSGNPYSCTRTEHIMFHYVPYVYEIVFYI